MKKMKSITLFALILLLVVGCTATQPDDTTGSVYDNMNNN